MSRPGSQHLCVVGSADFLRRMSAQLRQDNPVTERFKPSVSFSNPAEARSVIFAERPSVLVVDIGHKTSTDDLAWLRTLLGQVRERFKEEIYTILAITTPEKLAFGGMLLFADESSEEPSQLIDNLIISPPPSVPSIMTLEEQFIDCLDYAIEEMLRRASGQTPLPPLWSQGWVPSMCDPESRNVWMRWLPRYAMYINENPIIVGPTGSGKTRLARAIHKLSLRPGPFVSITPRDFSSTELVQAELFGSVAGAYTGAVEKWGLVKKAEQGTLFIDELQSIDRDLQGKLITFIENKSYRRVGEADSHTADVRFVFATNRSLQDLVADGSLRDDFAYRLERLQISLMPLHNRRLDISAGVAFALARVLREREIVRARFDKQGERTGRSSVEGLTNEAYSALFSSSWPGNLRQVENSVAKLIELADMRSLRLIDSECTGGTINSMLGASSASAADVFERASIDVALTATTSGFHSLSDCMFSLADSARAQALELSGGNPDQAAALINDSPQAMKLFCASRLAR
ncbi:MAG: sigma-54-dependent Fis family transcriptional regulator [Bdellovibrionales bacterium]|nr:sigma-54-dependent Fis family transcriptional regulator [Bdellovibrionales bacterium]